jgi:hypothetical protein
VAAVSALAADGVSVSRFSIATLDFAAVGVAAVLFSLHPASGTGVWIVLDIDRVTTNGVQGFRDYPLGRQIASRAVVGPVLACAVVTVLFATAVTISAFLLTNNLMDIRGWEKLSNPLIAVIVSFTILVPALVMRRLMLGTWFMPDPARAGIRHPVADLVWAASLASFADLCVTGLGPRGTPVFEISFVVLAAFPVIIYALALQPFRPPDNDAWLRANIGILFPVSAAGATAFVLMIVPFGRTVADFMQTASMTAETAAAAAASFVAAIVVLLQGAAGVVLVQVSGTASGRLARLAAAVRASAHLDRRFWLVIVFVVATAGWVWGDLFLRRSFGRSELLSLAGIAALLLATGSDLWLAIRWLGIVPWLEAQRAPARKVAYVAATSARRWWDTPWWGVPPLLGITLLQSAPGVWRTGLDLHMGVSLPIAVLLGYRYGRAALWPVAVGVLPVFLSWQIGDLQIQGAPVFIAVALFWTRYAGDPELRRNLLTAESLPPLDLALLLLACALGIKLTFWEDEGLGFSYDPAWLAVTSAAILGLSRMPVVPFLLGLAVLAVGGQVCESLYPDSSVSPGITWTTFVGAAATGLSTRLLLRRLMLGEDFEVQALGRRAQLHQPVVLMAILVIGVFAPIGYAVSAPPAVTEPQLLLLAHPAAVPIWLMFGLCIVPSRSTLLFMFLLAASQSIVVAGAPAAPWIVTTVVAVIRDFFLFAAIGAAIRRTAEGETRERPSPRDKPPESVGFFAKVKEYFESLNQRHLRQAEEVPVSEGVLGFFSVARRVDGRQASGGRGRLISASCYGRFRSSRRGGSPRRRGRTSRRQRRNRSSRFSRRLRPRRRVPALPPPSLVPAALQRSPPPRSARPC